MQSILKKLITIYLVMFRIGAITFGGGWSIISQVQEEFVNQRSWLSEEQIMDHMSLARTFPGIMVVNFSILTGYSMASFPGAIAAAFGLVSPAFITIALITMFYDSIRSNPFIIRVLNGVRSAVVPIILTSALKLKSRAITIKPHWLLAIGAFLLCTFTSITKPVIILVGALIGFFIQRKVENGNHLS